MFSSIWTYIYLLFVSTFAHAQQCKNYPGDPNWPDSARWQSLNATVSGRLSTPQPLGAVCHPSGPTYSNLSCSALLTQWSNTSFISENPFLADYNDETCSLIVPDSICSTTGYPAYIVSAANAADVQAGVNFARKHNLRLVVKGTGHDFPGRSSGSGALSIYTHNIRGISVNADDPYAVRFGGVASMTIAAGHRWREIYAEAAKHNFTVVGGADPNVGIGGWILNGGHSPVSSLYGLGADQVLSMEVVTADGQHLCVDETSHADLFWALRGGGGSTFAVMLSVTVKVYPKLSSSILTYSLSTFADSDTLYSMLAYFHTQIPSISEGGGMGYHYLLRGSALGTPDIDVLTGVWIFPNKSPEQMNAVLDPVHAAINTSSWAVDPIVLASNVTILPDAIAYLAVAGSETAGISARLGSWLLDGPGLTSNFTALKAALRSAAPSPWALLCHVVAGPGVRNAAANLPGGSNAVLPAWREAYAHLVLVRAWPTSPQNTTLKAILTTSLRETVVPALKGLSPDSGAYINEADPSNPTWKHDYFGCNYERLLSIKHRYDPNGAFWCKPCVGWDEWQIVGGDEGQPIEELGIGQAPGKLCRAAA